jgi:hypothetical protein
LINKKEEEKKEEAKEEKKEELHPFEKKIKDELKEESIEMLWRLCQEPSVVQGLSISVHKNAIDAFSQSLTYNSNETKWKYIVKIIEKLQQNDSVISC